MNAKLIYFHQASDEIFVNYYEFQQKALIVESFDLI